MLCQNSSEKNFAVVMLSMACVMAMGCGSVVKIDGATKGQTAQEAGQSNGNYPSLMVASADDLPACDSTIQGALAYATGSQEFFTCDNGEWKSINVAGRDGTNGRNGANGQDGIDGEDGVDGSNLAEIESIKYFAYNPEKPNIVSDDEGTALILGGEQRLAMNFFNGTVVTYKNGLVAIGFQALSCSSFWNYHENDPTPKVESFSFYCDKSLASCSMPLGVEYDLKYNTMAGTALALAGGSYDVFSHDFVLKFAPATATMTLDFAGLEYDAGLDDFIGIDRSVPYPLENSPRDYDDFVTDFKDAYNEPSFQCMPFIGFGGGGPA